MEGYATRSEAILKGLSVLADYGTKVDDVLGSSPEELKLDGHSMDVYPIQTPCGARCRIGVEEVDNRFFTWLVHPKSKNAQRI